MFFENKIIASNSPDILVALVFRAIYWYQFIKKNPLILAAFQFNYQQHNITTFNLFIHHLVFQKRTFLNLFKQCQWYP